MTDRTALFTVHEKGTRPLCRVQFSPPLFMAERKFRQGLHKVRIVRIRYHRLQRSRIEGRIFPLSGDHGDSRAWLSNLFFCSFPSIILHSLSSGILVGVHVVDAEIFPRHDFKNNVLNPGYCCLVDGGCINCSCHGGRGEKSHQKDKERELFH